MPNLSPRRESAWNTFGTDPAVTVIRLLLGTRLILTIRVPDCTQGSIRSRRVFAVIRMVLNLRMTPRVNVAIAIRIRSAQFKDKECDQCHKAFDYWKIPLIDHSLSRFELSGRHQSVPCSGCHKNGHYKPIDSTCSNCHYNFHEGQFDRACEACHTPERWSPVTDFDHQKETNYKLEGRHVDTECGKCHVNNQYTGTPTDCESCHVDVHKGQKGTDCVRCHTADSWSVNVGQAHDFGPFKIEGVHDEIACERCHGNDREQTLVGRGPECVNCHRDPHFGSLGPTCNDCHTQSACQVPSAQSDGVPPIRCASLVNVASVIQIESMGAYLINATSATQTPRATAAHQRDHTICLPGGRDGCDNCHTTQSWFPARVGAGCGLCE